MHSMSIEEHHHESSDEEGANDFRKTMYVLSFSLSFTSIDLFPLSEIFVCVV